MNHHTFEPRSKNMLSFFLLFLTFNSNRYPLGLMVNLYLRKERNEAMVREEGEKEKKTTHSLVNIHWTNIYGLPTIY